MGRTRALGGFGVEESRCKIDSFRLCKVSGLEGLYKWAIDGYLQVYRLMRPALSRIKNPG